MNDDSPPSDERSLRDVAAWLTTPAQCGVFLSPHDLRRIGAAIDIHVTPLNRGFAVEQLFRSAAIEGTLDTLLAALLSEVQAQQAAYQDFDVGEMQPWIERAGQTMAALVEMRQSSRRA